jgi:hypothetical protein
MILKELVKGKRVEFKYYRDGELWYKTDDGFELPVPPIADTELGFSKPRIVPWERERQEQARNIAPS